MRGKARSPGAAAPQAFPGTGTGGRRAGPSGGASAWFVLTLGRRKTASNFLSLTESVPLRAGRAVRGKPTWRPQGEFPRGGTNGSNPSLSSAESSSNRSRSGLSPPIGKEWAVAARRGWCAAGRHCFISVLNTPIVLSDDFARTYRRPLISLGQYPLRGLARPPRSAMRGALHDHREGGRCDPRIMVRYYTGRKKAASIVSKLTPNKKAQV